MLSFSDRFFFFCNFKCCDPNNSSSELSSLNFGCSSSFWPLTTLRFLIADEDSLLTLLLDKLGGGGHNLRARGGIFECLRRGRGRDGRNING